MCSSCGCDATEPVGEVTHYYGKPMVAVIELSGEISNGDKIEVKGATTEFVMTVEGIRNDAEEPVEVGNAGEKVAFKTPEKARPGDKIWLIKDEGSG
ncbi:U32 family peptidase C-terminal domain-containing protein [bacterium]|nr:U32 family peptidase C-terminal domain-containing protein [bacterium]